MKDEELSKAMIIWMKGQTLLDCYKQYSDQNNHHLRIILEVIQYLMNVESFYDYIRNEEKIVSELQDRYPGLMTIGATADLLAEADKYFEKTFDLFDNVEEIK